MKYKVILSNTFVKDLERVIKQGKNIAELDKVVQLLQTGEKLPDRYKDHQLKGNMKQFRELHIQPDWLLIYIRNKKELILTLSRTGSHAELLKK
ncbi:MAG: type II toxin-antitoxin system YafQ family toxin [Spirochaetaceae bacterium]|nr:type II toxin-antitoxin system YafQ family toxin [Spirochaetaceae bacterium]